jgi:hypothetical protein
VSRQLTQDSRLAWYSWPPIVALSTQPWADTDVTAARAARICFMVLAPTRSGEYQN